MKTNWKKKLARYISLGLSVTVMGTQTGSHLIYADVDNTVENVFVQDEAVDVFDDQEVITETYEESYDQSMEILGADENGEAFPEDVDLFISEEESMTETSESTEMYLEEADSAIEIFSDDAAGEHDIQSEADAETVLSEEDASEIVTEEDFTYEVITDSEEKEKIKITGYTGTAVDIVIPGEIDGKPVTTIGYNSFRYAGAVHVEIPESVETIEDYAFSNCYSLVSVHIPEGVKDLGSGVFDFCSQLQSVKLPSTLTQISDSLFYCCSSLEEIEIPDTVTDIGDYAFASCYTLESVVLPENLQTIGSGAFRDCMGMLTLSLPDGLTQIYDSAFASCRSLRAVQIPDSVTLLDKQTFEGCLALESFVFPKNMTHISENLLNDCQSLTEIIFPENLESIGSHSFFGTGLKEVIFPNTLKTIDSNAFGSCNDLKEVIFPDKLKTIGAYAFAYCGELTEVSLPDSVESAGNNAFAGCSNLSQVKLSEGMTEIAYGLFQECSSLTEITIPGSVVYIGGSAFASTGLTEIVIPDTVTGMGDGVFYKCYYLEEITLSSQLTEIPGSSFYMCELLSSITIPDGVTVIGAHAFGWCASLEEVELPSGLVQLGSWAFYYCSALKEIHIPDGVEVIDSSTFESCTALETVTLGQSVREIGWWAFCNCQSLKTVNWNEKLERINNYAFGGCGALKEVVLPDSVIYLGESVFGGSGLQKVKLPKYITELPQGLLDSCSALKEVVFPENLTEIGPAVFMNCESLESIRIPESVVKIGNSAFYGCSSLKEIGIPAAVTVYGSDLFANCAALETMVIPYGVTSLGDRIFAGCSSLKNVTIPESVTSIGSDAFADCRELMFLDIPDNVTSLVRTFTGCEGLQMVVIPVSVTRIEDLFLNTSVPLVTLVVEKDSYAENYAISAGYNYKYGSDLGVTLTVRLSGETDWSKYKGMQLTISDGDILVSQTISDETDYCFMALEKETRYYVRMTSVYGDEILFLDNLEMTETNEEVVLTSPVEVDSLYLSVRDENGVNVTEHADITWIRQDGDVYATGAELNGIPVDMELNCTIALDAEYGELYKTPKDFSWSIAQNGAYISVNLVPHRKIVLSGTVRDDVGTLAGASVVVKQELVSGKEVQNTAMADANGYFQMEIYNTAAQVTVSVNGYENAVISLADCDADTDLGEIILSELEGVEVSFKAAYRKAVPEGDMPKETLVNNLEGYDIRVFRETTGTDLEEMVIQGNRVILPYDILEGEVLQITVSSRANDFVSASCTAVVDAKRKAAAEVTLVQNGSVRVSVGTSENAKNRVLLYDADGVLVWYGSTEPNQILTSDTLEVGHYTVVVMGESDFLTAPSSLDGLQEAGYIKGQDYVLAETEVSDGVISSIDFGSVPLLEDSRFYYTDYANTFFLASSNKPDMGSYLTMRAKAAFKEEYQDRISDVKWIFEIPQGCSYKEGTLSVDGRFSASYEYSASRITVPTEDAEKIVRFCLLPKEDGMQKVSCSLSFMLDGKNIVQPVETVVLQVGILDFEMCEKTNYTTVYATGSAPAKSLVAIYDNGVRVGETTANYAGKWEIDFELYNPNTYSSHEIYAQIETTQGIRMRTQSRSLLYQYAEKPVRVSKVNLIYNNEVIPFDFLNPDKSGTSYYTYTGMRNATMMVEFEGEDLSRITNVQLDIIALDGSIQTVYPIWDESHGCWVISMTFSGGEKFPIDFRVRYDYTSDLVVSEKKTSDNQETLDALKHILETDLSADALPFDSVEMDAEMRALKDEFDQLQAQLTAEMENFDAELAENLGSFMETENGYALNIDGVAFEIKQTSCDGYTPEQLKADGFVETKTDLGNSVYFQMRDTGTFAYADFGANTYVETDISQMMRMMRSADEDRLIQWIDNVGKGAEWVAEKTYGIYRVVSDGIRLFDKAKVVGEKKSAYYAAEEIRTRDAYHIALEMGTTEVVDETLAEYEKAIKNKTAFEKFTDSAKKLIDNKHVQKFSKSLKESLKKCGPIGDGLGLIMDTAKYGEKLDRIVSGILSTDDQAMRREYENMGRLVGGAIIGGIITMIVSIEAGAAIVAAVAGATVSAPVWVPAAIFMGGIAFNYAISSWVDNAYENGWARINAMEAAKRQGAYENTHNGSDKKIIIDPSGYVYEAVASNRLPGVTTTVYEKVIQYDIYEEPYEEIEIWDSVPYDQKNPLITDELGQYAWDVPEGQWQVKYEKDGYETGYSEWMDVPPPRFDVNVGLVSYEPPTVSEIHAYTDEVEMIFSKYMETEYLNEGNVFVYADGELMDGYVTLTDEEVNPLDFSEYFASRVRFTPYTELEPGAVITVEVSDYVCSYAGVAAGEIAASAVVIEKPEFLTSDAVLEVEYGKTGTISIQAGPISAVAGMQVEVVNQSSMLANVSDMTLVLDEQGCASVEVETMLPGTAVVEFKLPGTDISSTTEIVIKMPEIQGDDDGTGDEDIIPEQKAEKIVLSGENELFVGENVQITAEVLPEDAVNRELIWSSSNPAIARVDETGKVTAAAAGSVTITAATVDGTVTESIRLTVYPSPKITLNKVKADLAVGQKTVLAANVLPAGLVVTWTNNNPSVAAVDQNGNVTAKAPGNTTVTATVKLLDRTASAKCEITVKPVLELTETKCDVVLNKSQQLHAASGIANAKVNWSSSNPKTVAVSAAGVVTGKKVGTAVITCSVNAGGISASKTCKITVLPKAILKNTKATLNIGKKLTLKVTKSPAKATVKWKSSNKKIATVSTKGVVKAKSPGIATITCTVTSSGIKNTATCIVTVKPAAPGKIKVTNIKGKKLQVKWSADKKVSGYEIEYAQNSKFKKQKKTVTVNSWKTAKQVIKNLKKNKKYYVRMRSFVNAGNEKVYSDYSKTYKITVKK